MKLKHLIEDLAHVLSLLEKDDAPNALRILTRIIQDIRSILRQGWSIAP